MLIKTTSGHASYGHTGGNWRLDEVLCACFPPDAHDFKMKLKEPTEMSVKELKKAICNAGLDSCWINKKSEFIKLVQDHRNSCSRF